MSTPETEPMDQHDSMTPISPALNARPFTLWDGIKTGLIVILAQILVTIPISIIGIGGAMAMGIDQEMAMKYVMGASLALSFPAAVWYILRKRTLAPTAWEWLPKDYSLLILSILMMLGVSYAIGGILEYAPGYEEMLKTYESMFEGIPPVVLMIAGGFIGPICEEIIFRGIILKEFLQTYSPTKAILYSALIFGIIHFIPLQVISAFFAGLVLGYIYYKTKSLWLPIIIHILNNVLAFALGVEAGPSDTRSFFSNEMLYLATFAAAIAIAWIAYKVFERVNGPARHEDASEAVIV